MGDNSKRLSTAQQVDNMCREQVPLQQVERLRSRAEQTASEKCKENHAVTDELKKQITELSHIRKSETVDKRIQKIEVAVDTLRGQTKPLKKSLNSALFSTDTELLELVGQTTRETLLEVGGSAAIDPVEVGLRIGAALDQVSQAMMDYQPDKSEWCDEWILDDNTDEMNAMYNSVYKDSHLTESHRFASRLAVLHRHSRELQLFSQTAESNELFSIEPAVYPFNADCDFLLQLVDVEKLEKQKKPREKTEKGAKKKEVGELVKVNDKANTVQSEEVSISNELTHVLKVLKKELKTRRTDSIRYFEFVTNAASYSRTVENMFYISYLMRDREVYLVEENGVAMLKKPPVLNEQEKKEWESQNSTHGVTSLSFDQWQRLSKVFTKTIIEPLEK